jgi:hypothetical protein
VQVSEIIYQDLWLEIPPSEPEIELTKGYNFVTKFFSIIGNSEPKNSATFDPKSRQSCHFFDHENPTFDPEIRQLIHKATFDPKIRQSCHFFTKNF